MSTAASPEKGPVAELAAWLRGGATATVLAGAGVSTASGIPDYRGPDGVWTRDPAAERRASIDVYVDDVEVRKQVWRQRAAGAARTAEPNDAHRALVDLERAGALEALITQNVDGLHQRAGTDPARLIEIHGTIHEVTCLSCGWRGPMEPVLERVRGGEPDPRCAACGGILKSATVSFGQPLDPDQLRRARAAAQACGVFLAVGTSLTVHPVAALPQVALTAGARLVIVNHQPTPYDHRAHVVVDADVGRFLTAVVRRMTADRG